MIRRVNPDFLWWNKTPTVGKQIPEVLAWLKVSPEVVPVQWFMYFVTQTIRPIPKDLIQRWECYHFMIIWDESHVDYYASSDAVNERGNFLPPSPQSLRVFQTKISRASLASLADCRQFVVQFPELVRILQAKWLLQRYLFAPFRVPPTLYDVRLTLGLSWNDIITALSALRPVIGRGTQKQVIAGTITIIALALELYPANLPSLTSDLAVGLLHLIQRIGASYLPMTIWSVVNCISAGPINGIAGLTWDPGLPRNGANSSELLHAQATNFCKNSTISFHPGIHSARIIVHGIVYVLASSIMLCNGSR
jgi:hypothetical protein